VSHSFLTELWIHIFGDLQFIVVMRGPSLVSIRWRKLACCSVRSFGNLERFVPERDPTKRAAIDADKICLADVSELGLEPLRTQQHWLAAISPDYDEVSTSRRQSHYVGWSHPVDELDEAGYLCDANSEGCE
jgi:hypothetical protein